MKLLSTGEQGQQRTIDEDNGRRGTTAIYCKDGTFGHDAMQHICNTSYLLPKMSVHVALWHVQKMRILQAERQDNNPLNEKTRETRMEQRSEKRFRTERLREGEYSTGTKTGIL